MTLRYRPSSSLKKSKICVIVMLLYYLCVLEYGGYGGDSGRGYGGQSYGGGGGGYGGSGRQVI